MLRNIGSTEIIIIALVILVLFGNKKIPEFVRAMGQSVREFRKSVRDDEKNKESDE
jgi:sec-independent protein translocase protein TatA